MLLLLRAFGARKHALFFRLELNANLFRFDQNCLMQTSKLGSMNVCVSLIYRCRVERASSGEVCSARRRFNVKSGRRMEASQYIAPLQCNRALG